MAARARKSEKCGEGQTERFLENFNDRRTERTAGLAREPRSLDRYSTGARGSARTRESAPGEAFFSFSSIFFSSFSFRPRADNAARDPAGGRKIAPAVPKRGDVSRRLPRGVFHFRPSADDAETKKGKGGNEERIKRLGGIGDDLFFFFFLVEAFREAVRKLRDSRGARGPRLARVF